MQHHVKFNNDDHVKNNNQFTVTCSILFCFHFMIDSWKDKIFLFNLTLRFQSLSLAFYVSYTP